MKPWRRFGPGGRLSADEIRSACEALVRRARRLKLTDPVAALPVYLRALEGWIVIGDAERFKVTFDETRAVEKLAGRKDLVAFSTVIDTIGRLVGPDVVRSRLQRFADMLDRIEEGKA